MSDQYYIPDGLRVYAIGDVHGMLDKLKAIHEAITVDLIASQPEKAHIVYMGDYIDRGPDSKGVIDYLIERRDRGDGIEKSFLLGNHELGLFEYLDDPVRDEWLAWGGFETLASYGITFEGDSYMLPSEREKAAVKLKEVMPPAHMEFLRSLENATTFGDYFFCHAGVDPSAPLDKQRSEDLIFIRQPFLNYHKQADYKPLPKRVVHGHTISKTPIERPHRVGVDTGAYQDGGKLTCGVFEGRIVRFLQV